MTRLSNSFDAGTDGATITTGNSGGTSGNAFQDVTFSTGSIVYNAANAYQGGMSAAIDPDTNAVAYLGYTTSIGTVSGLYGRMYVKFPTLPAGLVAIARVRDSTTSTNRGTLTVQTDGRIRLVDGTDTTVATTPNDSTGKLVANTWARLEWHWVGSATVGVWELKMYLTPGGFTPNSTTTATAINTVGTIDRVRVGQTTGVAQDIGVFYMDEIVLDTAGYPGPSYDHVHFLQTGQSLSIGGQANSNLTTVDPYPSIVLTPTSAPALIDAVEPVPGADWESGQVSFMKALYEHVGTDINTYSTHTSGHAATSYTGLKKGTTYYTNSMTYLGYAQNAAIALGRGFRCGGVLNVHGENDMLIGTTRAAYKAFVEEWQSDYQTDIQASTGQTGVVPFILTQVASWAAYVSQPTTGLGQLDAHRANPGKIIMAGPKYHLPYKTGGIHLTAEGYYDLGEYHAKVAKALYDGTTWEPVAPTLIVFANSTTINVTFSVPVAPLVFDTTTIPNMTNKGFSYTDDGAADISTVTITGDTTVQIVLNAPSGANPRLQYGFSTTDFGELLGGGGNLRDSDPYVGGRGSRVLRNWCVHFDDPIPFVNTTGLISAGLLDATPVLYTPTKVTRNIIVGLITATPTLFTPSSGGDLFVTSGGAFQANAFQNDAFQTGEGLFVDAVPVLYTPSADFAVGTIVNVPGPTATSGAFQADAFQNDAFQMAAPAEGIDHSPTLYTPVSVSATVAGAQFIYLTTDSAGWDSPLIVWDDPNHVWDENNISGLIQHTPHLFTPKVNEKVTAPLLDAVPVLYTPDVGGKTITVPLIQHIPALFDFSAKQLVYQADILDASPVIFTPSILAPIQPDLLDAVPVLYTPTVNPSFITPDLLNAIPVLFEPTVKLSVSPSLIDNTPQLFAPNVGNVISPGLIDHTPELLTPSLERLFPPLLDAIPEIFEPAKVNNPLNTVIRLDDSADGLIDVSAQLFTPDSASLAEAQVINCTYIDESATVFAPRIFLGSFVVPVTRKIATFQPVLRRSATFQPILFKEASLLGVKSPITEDDAWFVGEDQTFEFLSLTSGRPDDLTGWTIQFRMATAQGEPSILTVSAVLSDPTDGEFQIVTASADTASLEPETYYYDVSRLDSGSNQVLAFGDAVLQARVS